MSRPGIPAVHGGEDVNMAGSANNWGDGDFITAGPHGVVYLMWVVSTDLLD
jgi:hypothetical protein